MRSPLLHIYPELLARHQLGFSRLIETPTPVHALSGARELLGHDRFFVKREDLTDSLYGGNKVRNLEFLLGTALARGARKVVTMAPLGSNFVGALSAQAKRTGLESEIFHFIPGQVSPQMAAHAAFSENLGSALRISGGGKYLSAAMAQAKMLTSLANRQTVGLPPGGSSALGVLGHVNALLELNDQILAGEIPEPDFLVVGVGTCGTMAGLLAGLKIARLKTQVIGIRCVDPIVCNAYHISSLANGALKLLGVSERVRAKEVQLHTATGTIYGQPLAGANTLIGEVREKSGIELDTTYTTKVFASLQAMARAGKFADSDVLFWNTYSPAAVKAKFGASVRPTMEKAQPAQSA